MSAVLARNWWAVGLRSLVAVAFAIAVILLLPRPTLGALVLLFAAYLAADGALAIVAGVRAMRRGELWQALMFEGAANLMVAGAVLIWPAMAAVAFVPLTSAWAIVTGALLLAAARRLARSHGRWLFVLAGALSTTWGALAAAVGPSAGSTPETVGWWLVGYALPFAIVLMALAGLLQWRDRKASISASGSVPDVAKIDLIGTQDEKIYLEFSTVARERGQ
jgi:uncharacterized membrane protein HdeD (DUF308 family)